jgi:hypothetical protein
MHKSPELSSSMQDGHPLLIPTCSCKKSSCADRIALFYTHYTTLYCTLPQLGHPIVGDVKYGAPQTFKTRDIALHAYALTVAHPITAIEVKYPSNHSFHFCSPILRSTHFTLILRISRSLFGRLLCLSHLSVETRELSTEPRFL